MKLKQIPEDFVVKEIGGYSQGNGSYAIFLLKKRDYTTEKAVHTICKSLRIDRKRIGYAGIKDRQAVTEQYISIENVKREKIEELNLNDIELKFVCFSNTRLSMGDLQGNKFEIMIRDLDKNVKINSNKKIKNYFDEQRFSNNNAEIGKAIVQKDFKKAVNLILENKGDYENDVTIFLEKQPNNYIEALKRIPHKILLLFVHAYQSLIFNKTIEHFDSENNFKLPLVGFGTEFENEKIERIVSDILEQEGISDRDFIIQAIPSLSCEGSERDLYVEPKDLVMSELEKDELNKGKYKMKINFLLPKGAYATNVVKSLFSE